MMTIMHRVPMLRRAADAGRRRFALLNVAIAILVALAVVPQVGVRAFQATPVAESAPVAVPANGTYLGFNVDPSADSPASVTDRLGFRPAAFVDTFGYPLDAGGQAALSGFIAQVADGGGIAILSVTLQMPLAEVSAENATAFAAAVASANAPGVPILVRFAPEMNGSWQPWGQQPEAYIAAFRIVAEAIHAGTPGAGMLWAPSYAGGYPFRSNPEDAVSESDFAFLDTDGDGVLTQHDDAYRPYYPGNDAVDWVGLTLYHWGNAFPWGENEVPEDGKYAALITGTYDGLNGNARDVRDFYAAFVTNRGKPMMVETAAFFNTAPAEEGADELAIKQAWWRQVFSPGVAAAMPGIKLVVWLEWQRPENETDRAEVDWRVTFSPAIRAAFLEDLPRDRIVLAGGASPEASPQASPAATPAATPRSTRVALTGAGR